MATSKRKKLTRTTAISAGFGSIAGSMVFTVAIIAFLYILLKPRLDKLDVLYNKIIRDIDLLKKNYPYLFKE